MKNKFSKKKVLIILLILLVTSLVVGTVAYYFVLNSKSNIFTEGTIKLEIIENFNSENNIKENVLIKNTGNSPIYIRVAILYLFENNDGQIIEDIPIKDTDYTINFSSSNNWVLNSDGYYYYKYPIEPGSNTDILIDNCKQIKEYDDKSFIVDVLAQAIQTNPNKAVKEAWNINVEDNKIMLE